jgi:tetratricopeptide (TPR) repeat protein
VEPVASDRPPGKVLPFARPRRFPADLDRLRRMLDDEYAEFEDSDVDDGIACAEAAIAQGVPGGDGVRADLLNIRAHRILAAGDADAALAAWAALVASYPTYLAAYVMRADVLGKRGDHEAALAELDGYIERSPTDANGYLARAKLYQASGDGERALANFRRAAQLDRTSSEAHLGVAQALAAKGDARGAARAFAKAAEEELGDAESYDLRAFSHFMSGQDELALADYEASMALDPHNPETVAWRGICRLRLGRHEGAIADFTRLIAMKPAEVRGYWRRGEALVRAGKHAEALRDLDRAIALGGDERGAAHLARGMALEALGDVEAALAAYDAAIERDPSNAASRLRRFQIYAAREDWVHCQIDAEAMLARTPDSPSLLLTHARLCVRTARRDDALAAYDRLIALEPGNADAHHERSALHVGRGDTLAARADLARAFELSPDNPDIRAAHGRDLAQTAKTDDERAAALQLIASSAELDAQNPEAWANAAGRFREAGYSAEAVPFITRAIELDPDNADYLDERATCLSCAAPPQSIDPDGYRASHLAALADIERAIELMDEDDLELIRHRARLREDTGDLEGAIADHTHIIEEAPDFIDSHADRARLRKHTGDMAGALEDAARVKLMEDETITEMAAFADMTNMKRFDLNEE